MKSRRLSYSELMQIDTFEDRFLYLQQSAKGVPIGVETFGCNRYLYERFLNSDEWKSIRNKVIDRDNGCDLGIYGHDIHSRATVHHINPITKEDVLNHSPKLFDLDNLITSSLYTHNALHYGSLNSLPEPLKERSKNDTCPWRN